MTLLRRCSLVLILIAAAAVHAAAQTALVDPMVVLNHAADGVEGLPAELTEGADGMLYGIGRSPLRFASIFRIDPIARTHTIVARLDFGPEWECCGYPPLMTTLERGGDGRMYGAWMLRMGDGGVFSFDPATLEVAHVHDFPTYEDDNFELVAPDGAFPAGVTMGSDGFLYVPLGYSGDPTSPYGMITRIDPGSGAIERLYQAPADSFFRPATAMIEGPPGIWYGAANRNHPACGSLHRFDGNTGELTTLKTFNGADGCRPDGLMRAADGRIFGITAGGPGDPAVPGSIGWGSIISIDPVTDAVTTVYSFGAGVCCRGPLPDVSIGTDAMLYVTVQGIVSSTWPFHGDKQIVRVNPNTGAGSVIATLPDPGLFAPTGMFLGSDGRFFGVVQAAGFAQLSIVYAVGVLDEIPLAIASAPFGGTTSVSATLKAIGVPLAGRTIAFTLNGSAIGSAVTDDQGVATLSNVSVSGIAIGTHAIGASFAGDDYFPSTFGDGSLTVYAVPTPGLMIGHGFVRPNDIKHEFAFIVVEDANGANVGGFELTRKSKGKVRDDRFVSTALSGVAFDGEAVTFGGTGTWNGVSGYRFEAVAADVAGPGNHDTVRVTIYDGANHAVVTFDQEVDGGNIQSLRLRR